jgi:hypothetical protein
MMKTTTRHSWLKMITCPAWEGPSSSLSGDDMGGDADISFGEGGGKVHPKRFSLSLLKIMKTSKINVVCICRLVYFFL